MEKPTHEHSPSHAIPLEERRGPLTMGLLWTTMVTGFPTVLVGFEWYKQAFTLSQILICVVVSTAILLAYSIPACYLGAKTGLSYTVLSRTAFGRWGSWLVSFNIAWMSIAWYALTAVFLADALIGLFHLSISVVWLAAGMAVLMAFNNFFGFKGVANFARYAAGPLLIVWVVYSFAKAAGQVPSAVWSQAPTHSLLQVLTVVSAFVIGYAVWGNEADYWRYGRPSIGKTSLPLLVSISIGQIAFPVTGWLVAYLTHTVEKAEAAAAMNHFAFGGATIIAAVVLTATYVAVNDSLLYATANALDNIRPMVRRKRVGMLCLLGCVLAAVLSQYSSAFEVVASVSSIVLPAATTIIMVEAFFPRLNQKAAAETTVGWAAVIALFIGCVAGIGTSGILPGTDSIGVPALQGWLVSLVAYIVLRAAMNRSEKR